jgi:adenylylsulfate kinase
MSAAGPFAIWMTGLPASGKSAVREALVGRLASRGVRVAVLESDALRQVLGSGYDDVGRERFYGALLWIGRLLLDHGVPVVFDATANRRVWRDRAREVIPRFLEVWVDTPLEVCIARDPKGLYRRGLGDEGGHVPGLHVAYEAPLAPEVRIQGASTPPGEAAEAVLGELIARGLVSGDA